MNMITRNMNNIKNNVIAIVETYKSNERYKREGVQRLYQATLLTRLGIQAKLDSL